MAGGSMSTGWIVMQIALIRAAHWLHFLSSLLVRLSVCWNSLEKKMGGVSVAVFYFLKMLS
jgi:hypothetical protein